MFITFRNIAATAWMAAFSVLFLQAEDVTVSAEQLDRLEQRIADLEARLADQEQETKEVKVLASSGAAVGGQSGGSILGNAATFDILAGSAWRNLRWTQEAQWMEVRRGISEERVVELLGMPPRSVKSLKPRIDKVLYYETSISDSKNGMSGKISLKDGEVVAVEKPNFQRGDRSR